MDVSVISNNLGALRQYKTAQKALAPDLTSKSNGVLSNTQPDSASTISKGVEDFSAVFKNVENTVQANAVGQADAHSVVEAMANAEMALETAVTIRNRVVEAYQELLRMPV